MRAIDTQLFRYSEWLDAQGLIMSDQEEGADKRTHEQLVQQFLNGGLPMTAVPQAAADESVLREHVASWNPSGTAMVCSCGWEGTKAHVPTEPADREWRRHFAVAVVASMSTIPRAAVDAHEIGFRSPTKAACSCGGWWWQGKDRECHAEFRKHFAAAVVAAVQGPIKAEALREAADEWQRGAGLTVMTPRGVGVPAIDYAQRTLDWLRARADRIEAP